MPQDVIAEVRELARQGFKEITLLGQNVNAYGKDFDDIDYRFADLMDEIRKIDIPRVRFTTSHPRDFDDRSDRSAGQRRQSGGAYSSAGAVRQHGNFEEDEPQIHREQYLGTCAQNPTGDPGCGADDGYYRRLSRARRKNSSRRRCRWCAKWGSIRRLRSSTRRAKEHPLQRWKTMCREVKKDRLHATERLMAELSLESNRKLEGQVVEVLVEGKARTIRICCPDGPARTSWCTSVVQKI